jgi:membrane protease YdiL (CAAX protease family)
LLGAVTQLLLVPVLYVPIFWLLGEQDVSAAARGLSDRADSSLGIGLLVLVVGIGAPIVEEIYYRGLVQQSLSAKIGSTAAILMTSFVFGLSHFQLLQLPALVLFGTIVGVAARRFGRLGLSIWTHVGFNLVTVVALLAA